MKDEQDTAPTEPASVKASNRAQIAEDVAAYLQQGGQITRLDPCRFTPDHKTESRWHRLEFGMESIFDGKTERTDRGSK